MFLAGCERFRQRCSAIIPSERKVHIMFNTKEEMQRAIDAAWRNPSPEHKLFQQQHFPHGDPTVEEFIKTVAVLARKEMAN